MNIEQVWEEYRSSIKGFLHSKISDPDDVDDLLQEILIKTYKNLGSIKSESSVKSWVFQIAKNTIVDFYRKRSRSQGLQAEDLWYEDNEPETEHALSNCVAPFIKALPEDTAKMLLAIEIEGQSQKAYAKEQGISYSTLKSRVQSGRQKLFGLFGECCHLMLDNRGKVIGYEAKSVDCKSC